MLELNVIQELDFLILALIIALAWYLLKRNYWEELGIPYIKPEPLYLRIFTRRLSFGEKYKLYYDKYKNEKFIGVFEMYKPLLLINDVDLIKDVMVNNFSTFPERSNTFNESDLLSHHLFNLKGEQWLKLRKKLTNVFTPAKIKKMLPLINDCSKDMINYICKSIEETNIIEIKEIAARFTTDVIGACAFGLKLNSFETPNSEFRKKGSQVLQLTFRRKIRMFFPKIFEWLKLTVLPKEVNTFFLNIVKDTIEYRRKNATTKEDFIQLLIDLDEKQEFSYEILAAQAFMFFIAGYETSAATLSFCLYELAKNSDIQRKLREELKDEKKKNNNTLDYNVIEMKCKYLDSIVNEALRKYPPLSNLLRKSTEEFQIPKSSIKLQKGTKIVIPVYALQHDEDYFSNPEEFIPERGEHNKFTYLPFGEGPRKCLGSKFGQLQVKVGLLNIVLNYDVGLSSMTDSNPKFDTRSLVTSFKGGIWLRFTPLL